MSSGGDFGAGDAEEESDRVEPEAGPARASEVAGEILLEGRVVERAGETVRVSSGEVAYRARLRGRFRLETRDVPSILAGDVVRFRPSPGGDAVITEVLPRRTVSWRSTSGGRVQAVAANVDLLLVVLAARDPEPRWSLVDRMLIQAERDGLDGALCVNKSDLLEEDPEARLVLDRILETYRALGFAVVVTSAFTGAGIEALEALLRGKRAAAAGHSGVGKSSLLNRLVPGSGLLTREVNPVTGKGRHVTTSVRILDLPGGGEVVDTPGFREFLPVSVSPAELGRNYREFRPFLGACRYKDCLHLQEPRCAIREAVASGSIPKLRYENYLQILEDLRRDPREDRYPKSR